MARVVGVAGRALPRLVADILAARVAGAAPVAAAAVTTHADARRDGTGRAARARQGTNGSTGSVTGSLAVRRRCRTTLSRRAAA